MRSTSKPTAETPLLCFTVAAYDCAVPLDDVQGFIAYRPPAPTGATDPVHRGFLFVGPTAVSVIDLRARFGFGPPEDMANSSIVILGQPPLCTGLIVDSVDLVWLGQECDWEPTPDQYRGRPEIRGSVRAGTRSRLVLDPGFLVGRFEARPCA